MNTAVAAAMQKQSLTVMSTALLRNMYVILLGKLGTTSTQKTLR
jgi:hypothetical protein